MSKGSAIKLYYAAEETPGVLPAVPVWKTVRRVTDGLTENVTTSTSNSVLDSRFRQGSTADESEITGSLEVELSIGTFDDFISAVAMNGWVVDGVDAEKSTLQFGGDTTKTFTFVKVFSDLNKIHVYKGIRIGEFGLSIATTGKITSKFGLVGTDFESVAVNPVSSPQPVDDNVLVSALNVNTMTVNGQNTVGTACVQSVELSVTNNLSPYRCIGSGKLSAQGYNDKMVDITMNTQFMFTSQSATYIPYVKSRATMPLEFAIEDPAGNKYAFNFPQLEVSEAGHPDGGGEDDIMLDVSFAHIKTSPVITRTLVA